MEAGVVLDTAKAKCKVLHLVHGNPRRVSHPWRCSRKAGLGPGQPKLVGEDSQPTVGLGLGGL